MDKKVSNPVRVALSDISKYMNENNINTNIGPCKEVWVLNPSSLDTKENRQLNRELGLHIINRLKH